MENDLISRSKALDLVCTKWREHTEPTKRYELLAEALEEIVIGLKDLPRSAQPEQLTDKEQRIFLAAMGREEKVCKEVDDECRPCREPYEDSLVRICHEITRKVKGALWNGN